VFFNGTHRASRFLNDLWDYQGPQIGWQRVIPAGTKPPQRSAAADVRLDGEGQLLVLGGVAANGRALDDLWIYHPTPNRWEQLSGVSPTARSAPAMAWDPDGQRLFIFGGAGDDNVALGDLWIYDRVSGNTTQFLPSGERPGPRVGASAVWDPAKARVFMVGGIGSDGVALDEVWTFTPATGIWQKLLFSSEVPGSRGGAALVWDPAGQQALLFGGTGDQGVLFGDFWTYDANTNTWKRILPAGPMPGPRAAPKFELDTVEGTALLFGGVGPDSTFLNDLWRYDPSNNIWLELILSSSVPTP
jgi:N-acetylneuraminic acid mutarotase